MFLNVWLQQSFSGISRLAAENMEICVRTWHISILMGLKNKPFTMGQTNEWTKTNYHWMIFPLLMQLGLLKDFIFYVDFSSGLEKTPLTIGTKLSPSKEQPSPSIVPQKISKLTMLMILLTYTKNFEAHVIFSLSFFVYHENL